MGKEKYLKQIKELFEKSPVVDYSSIERIIRGRKKTSHYAKQLIKSLIIKGKINRLAKGFYTSAKDASLAVFCFKSAYLGLQDALSFHNLWEQETIPIIITSRRVRPGIRNIMGANVLVRRMENKYFFGFDYFQQGNFYLPYSDIEKTFIDFVHFKEKLDPETVKNINKKLNRKKLNLYLKKYPKRIGKIVEGYLKIK